MKKLLTVAWKDLLITFRDPTALLMMLLTPFLITLVMAFAFGGLGGGSVTLSHINVSIADNDGGQFSQIVVDVLRSPDLADLLNPTLAADAAAARAAVDADRASAAVIIPIGFSQAVLAGGNATPPTLVEVYMNPTRAVSAGVVRSIVDQTLARLNASAVSGRVAVTQLAMSGLLSPQQVMAEGAAIAERAARQTGEARLITLRSDTAEKSTGADFDWLTYMTPSMAIMFLMFTVSNGGRSILAERDWGTLQRLLTTPTQPGQIIGGKVVGIFLTGLAQMAILIATGGLLFGVKWGSALGVAVLTIALVAAATGWGALLAAYARTSSQANQLGTMIALFFGILAGNMMPRPLLPQWLRTASYVTPNAWGLEGYSSLSAGGGVSEIVFPTLALLAMAAVLYAAATVAFRRQFS